MLDWSRYPNFTEDEMRCKGEACCGGRADMDPEFMSMLQGLRTAYGKPMAVTSAYRCPDHNDRVSGTGRDGPHTTGRAADVAVARRSSFELLKFAFLWGMTGIGVKQRGPPDKRFIHLDNLLELYEGDRLVRPRPTTWSY